MRFYIRKMLIILTFISPLCLSAQYDFMKYGKIEKDDYNMTHYSKDSTADAVILGDNGNVYFQINNKGDGWEMVYERHVRIKIFNKKGYDYANVVIPLFRNDDLQDKVTSLKGTTYNLVNGEVVKTALKNDNIFNEVVSERRIMQKFAMPAIREGCIIEYQYTKVSGFIFSLADWCFQYAIPVARSEFNACIPKFFVYNTTLRGYYGLTDFQSDFKDETFTIPYKTLPQRGGLIEEGKYTIQSISAFTHWIMKDMPAFKSEPYMSNETNFISALSFELASYTFPGDMKKSFTETWSSINRDLLDDDYFGKQLKSPKFLGNELIIAKYGDLDTLQKINILLDAVKKKVKWNGRHALFASDDLVKIHAQHSGNSADINLMLIAALREAGIFAFPVVLSTKDNGIIIPSHPSLAQLNHVIALAKVGEKNILIDASEPFVPLGFLPKECLNGFGYIVQPKFTESLRLDSMGVSSIVSSIDLHLGENGAFYGNVTHIYKDYAAIEKRIEIRECNSIVKTEEAIQKKYPEAEISNLNLIDKDSVNTPLRIEYGIVLTNKTNNGIVYINPFIGNNKFVNPFNQEKRLHPIDFGYPGNETYLFKVIIPEGYEVVEKPENVIMGIPDKSMKVTYSISEIGNMIQVLYKFSINRSTYLATEYDNIRALFTEIVKKQSQNIVLKKKI